MVSIVCTVSVVSVALLQGGVERKVDGRERHDAHQRRGETLVQSRRSLMLHGGTHARGDGVKLTWSGSVVRGRVRVKVEW